MNRKWSFNLLLVLALLGWTGARCETDVDECASGLVSCGPGRCENTEGGYICVCTPGYCGDDCALPDPCFAPREGAATEREAEGGAEGEALGPCENGGVCSQTCSSVADYVCRCAEGWAGRNCSEAAEGGAWGGAGGGAWPAALGAGGAAVALLLAAGAGWLLAAQARRKRATRGTYSPSGQEYCNPRAEMMHHALKPPPEERLI